MTRQDCNQPGMCDKTIKTNMMYITQQSVRNSRSFAKYHQTIISTNDWHRAIFSHFYGAWWFVIMRIPHTYLVFFDEIYESCPFDLDGLTLAVIQRQNEVKEVAFAKVARRLLLIVRPSHTETKNTESHILLRRNSFFFIGIQTWLWWFYLI